MMRHEATWWQRFELCTVIAETRTWCLDFSTPMWECVDGKTGGVSQS
jgi:hypothetical protein